MKWANWSFVICPRSFLIDALTFLRLNNKMHCTKNADLVTFTEEILNGKLHFLCSDKFKFDARLLETCHENFLKHPRKSHIHRHIKYTVNFAYRDIYRIYSRERPVCSFTVRILRGGTYSGHVFKEVLVKRILIHHVWNIWNIMYRRRKRSKYIEIEIVSESQ